ncbi:MAG: flagellar hook-basal body protein [Anaerolineales bacterium]|nr:flagellar hook-basal body protein [Anaerolineales bacterium]
MIKGLYAAASAMLAGLTRQNIISHNLANIDTPGFKQVLTSLDDFVDTPVSTHTRAAGWFTPLRLVNQPRALGDLGLGVETIEPVTDFEDGALRQTSQPLDLALNGAGFFRVQTPDGERYTRDGRFLRDAGGTLVTVDGFQVLNAAGAPITLPEGTVSVAGDGTLAVNGQAAGQLGLAAFTDPATELSRDPTNGNLFTAAGAPTGTVAGTVVQGYLETANINPAQLMTQMVSVGRAYEAAQRLVQTQDDLLGRAIATISRL